MAENYQPSLFYTVENKYCDLVDQIAEMYTSDDYDHTYDTLIEIINDQIIYYDDQMVIVSYYLFNNTDKMNSEGTFDNAIEIFIDDVSEKITSLGYTIND